MNRQQFAVIEENQKSQADSQPVGENSIARITAFGSAVSDSIRIRMLNLLVTATDEGRSCCDLPDLGVPAEAEETGLGLCVCEFEEYFGMGQSKVSYHLRKLKDAGLVREKKRGKWSFYSLDKEAATQLIQELNGQLGIVTTNYE